MAEELSRVIADLSADARRDLARAVAGLKIPHAITPEGMRVDLDALTAAQVADLMAHACRGLPWAGPPPSPSPPASAPAPSPARGAGASTRLAFNATVKRLSRPSGFGPST